MARKSLGYAYPADGEARAISAFDAKVRQEFKNPSICLLTFVEEILHGLEAEVVDAAA